LGDAAVVIEQLALSGWS